MPSARARILGEGPETAAQSSASAPASPCRAQKHLFQCLALAHIVAHPQLHGIQQTQEALFQLHRAVALVLGNAPHHGMPSSRVARSLHESSIVSSSAGFSFSISMASIPAAALGTTGEAVELEHHQAAYSSRRPLDHQSRACCQHTAFLLVKASSEQLDERAQRGRRLLLGAITNLLTRSSCLTSVSSVLAS